MWRVLLILLALCSVAQAQTGGGGITPTGTITPGDCMMWGATKFKAADSGAPCFGGASSFANPTAQVGLTAVNGSAFTAMRSDGAPSLDQSIAPTWTGVHTHTLAANAVPITTNSSNTGSGQTSALTINHTLNTSGSPDVFAVRVTDTARGAATTLLNLYAGATGVTTMFSVSRVGGLTTNGLISAGGNITTPNVGEFNWAGRGILTSPTSGMVQLGAVSAASPVAQTLRSQGSRAGTDTNVGGSDLTIISGNGTGIGTLSNLILQSPVAVASGNGAQTQTTGLIIRNGAASVGSATLTISPGSMGITRITTSGTAPGALGGKIELTCGTTGGTARLIAYAGTSATPVTIVDNIGMGVSGC